MSILFSKIRHLNRKTGSLSLFVIRLPIRIKNTILCKLSTYFWRYYLKSVGSNCIIEWGASFEHPKSVTLKTNVYIGKKCKFKSEFLGSELILENNVQISENCLIDHSGNIIIGKNTLLSSDVCIFSHSHGYKPRSTPHKMPLTISDNCWIGYRSIILESVEIINSDIIIAAGSIVTKSCLASNSVYAGIPAKKVKNIDI